MVYNFQVIKDNITKLCREKRQKSYILAAAVVSTASCDKLMCL